MTNEKALFAEQLRTRTKANAVEVIRLFRLFPKTEEARIIGRQLIRCATSVAANYRAACRARSKAEFYAKLSICVEECDETIFWLEVTEESQIHISEKIIRIKAETLEVLKVLAAARKKASD
jgi:four helix bundle protein